VSPDDLVAIIRRILAGGGSSADSETLQSGLIDGRVLLTGTQTVEVGRDIRQSLIMVGNQQIHLTLDYDSLEALRNAAFPKAKGVPPPFASLLFVGRGKEVREIRTKLRGSQAGRMLVIFGWPGVGKTSIANALASDHRIMRQFPCGVLWTSVGLSDESEKKDPEAKLKSLLTSWGSSLNSPEIWGAPTLDSASQELAKFLIDKKMLLMVDDVWETEHLLPFLKALGDSPGCRLVATTRLRDVADSFTANPATVHTLPVLDELDAVALFQAIAPKVAAEHPEECLELVRALEHLPLSIHVAARLLKIESSYNWGIVDLIEDIKTGDAVLKARPPDDRLENGTERTVAALLRKSTDLLSPSIRGYYASLGELEAKPAAFDLRTLETLWDVEDPKPIVRELARRGLLEPLPQGRFQMHALLVAHARSLPD